MKNLNDIKLKDQSIKNEKENEVLTYVRALIRNEELEKLLKKRSFKDAKRELLSAHEGIDIMTCDEEVIYQVLKTKAKSYVEDRKQVILLKRECQILPSRKDIEILSLTDKIHLILIAHTLCKSINLSERLLENANISVPLYEWYDKFGGNSSCKDVIRACCHKMFGKEGELFYGVKIRRGCLKLENINFLLLSLKLEKNKNKHYRLLTDYFCEILYSNDSEYEVIRELTDKRIIDIGIHDFVVKCNVFRCMHKEHTISDIIGMIHVKLKNDTEELLKVSAGYCNECKIFFILDSTYRRLFNKGNILCRIIDEKTYINKSYLYGNKLARESLLMQYGYNVSQADSLPEKRRHDILSFIIDNGILTKSEIISYLNFFINQSKHRSNMENAILKWERDCIFVEKYNNIDYKKIEVKSIRRR